MQNQQQHHDAKAEARQHEAQADAATRAATKGKAAIKPRATMPVGGTIVSASRDYSVLSATVDPLKPELGVVFLPGMPVVAWSIDPATGISWPLTAAPVSPDVVATGTLHVDGRVHGDDGVLYAGALEWQAAVRAANEPALAELKAAKEAAEAKAAKEARAAKEEKDEEAAAKAKADAAAKAKADAKVA